MRHWQYYIAKAKVLRKVFVSVKGIYYQAEILGENVTWLSPHPFTQAIPKEVDLRVMITFLEFYEVFLRFVFFKLYHSLQLKYPPVIDQQLHDAGCHLLAVKAEPLDHDNTPVSVTASSSDQSVTVSSHHAVPTASSDNAPEDRSTIIASKLKLSSLAGMMSAIVSHDEQHVDKEGENGSSISTSDPRVLALRDLAEDRDDMELEDDERRVFAAQTSTSTDGGNNSFLIFKGLTFFVNREVHLEWAQLCLCSFGAIVGWDGPGSPLLVTDKSITHQVVDRPVQSIGDDREYVQPQWIFDSINARMLLPTLRYRPGAVLPPHLSPFVDDSKEGYLPRYREELMRLKSAPEMALASPVSSAQNDVVEDEEEEYEKEVRAERAGQAYSKKNSAAKQQQQKEVLDEEEDEEGSESDLDSDDEPEEEEAPVKGKKNRKEVNQSKVDVKSGKLLEGTASAPGPKGVVHAPVEAHQSEVSV